MTAYRPSARTRRTSSMTSYLLTSGLLLALGGGCADEALTPSSQDKDDKLDESRDAEDKSDEDTEDSADEAAEAPSDSADSDGEGDDKGTGADSVGPSPTADAGTAPSDKSAATWCDVKPLIDKYCSACHDGEGTAPMALNTAADFALDSPKADGKVYESVAARLHDTKSPMPPPPKKVSEEELAILDEWLAAKAPASEETCEETAAADGKVDGWDPEACDEIYELRAHGSGGPDDPYVIRAGAEIHPQISIDAPWGNERVQAIGFKPLTDNKKVLHHWILNGAGQAFLAGWAPGDDERPPFPEDVGMDMPTGRGAFTLDMHYYNLEGTQSEMDRSGVAVCVLKGDNLRKHLAAVTGSFSSFGAGGVLAPRQQVDAPATSVCNVTLTGSEPVHLLTAAPHAHKYASHMKFTVTKKDGTEIVMHDEPWVYGEQGTYPLPGGEILIETGDKVTTVCSYTNMTNRDIRIGSSTEDEMCFNFALYYPKGGFTCGGGRGGLLGN